MSAPSSSLQIKKQLSASNPNQVAFNKLVKKLESARLKFEKTRQMLDEKRAFAEEHIRPALVKKMQEELKWIELCFEECQATKGKKKKGLIARFILREIESLYLIPTIITEVQDSRLQEIANVCEDLGFPPAYSNEDDFPELDGLIFSEMMSNLEDQFRSKGLDIDLSDLPPDLSPEELKERVSQRMDEANAAAQEKNITKKKLNKKEIERQEKLIQKEEARKKSIGSIYKGLAKVLHPDLEKDPDERLRKEEFMKKLTIAYKDNDLYSLLMLEKQWMGDSQERLNTLSDDQLKIYLEVFREQVSELETNETGLLHHHDYAFICCLADGPFHLKRWRPEIACEEIDSRREFLLKILGDMSRSTVLRKAILSQTFDRFKEDEVEEDDDFWDFDNF